MKFSVVVLLLVVASLAVPILSFTAAAQVPFDRDSCLRNCAWLKPVGRDYGGWMNYNNCVAGCEKRFWDEFDQKTKDLEREGGKD